MADDESQSDDPLSPPDPPVWFDRMVRFGLLATLLVCAAAFGTTAYVVSQYVASAALGILLSFAAGTIPLLTFVGCVRSVAGSYRPDD